MRISRNIQMAKTIFLHLQNGSMWKLSSQYFATLSNYDVHGSTLHLQILSRLSLAFTQTWRRAFQIAFPLFGQRVERQY